VEPRSPRTQDLDETLIPLINVVFLMLIFFMLAGRITAPDALPVAPPESRSAGPGTAGETTLIIGVDGRMALDGKILDGGELPLSAEALAMDAPPLRIKADAGLPVAELQRVLRQLRQAGVARIELLTLPAGDS